jgi:hypothetical protein
MERDQLLQLKQEYERHKMNRATVEPTWDQIEKFIDPLGNGRISQAPESESDILWRRIDVWDFSAIEGSEKLTAIIHGTETNPAVQWFTGEFRDPELQKDKIAREWLEDCLGRTYQALQDSDFNTEIATSFGDLVNYGNSFIIEEAKSKGPKWEGIDFTCVPIREGYFERDSYGNIKRFWRRLSWTARQIIDRCKGQNIPEKIAEEARKPEGGTDTHEVVFCVFPRDVHGEPYDEKGEPRVLAPELRPIGSVYFLADTGEQCGNEDGYYEMQSFHAPWKETAGSQWGHGKGGQVLPTVKLLNALWEVYLGAAELAILPALLVTERGLMSAVDLGPGGMTVVKDIVNSIKAFENGAKFEVTWQMISQLQLAIRKAFHEDELHLKDSPAMTATEAAIRFENMNRVMGSVLSRVQSFQLIPIIKLTMSILRREGRLKPAPEIVRRKSGEVNIVFLGPLSRAQRTDEVSAIERAFSFVAQARKLGFEEAADVFDAAAAAREVMKRLGVPASCMKSEADAQLAQKQRKAQASAAAQAELAKRAGEAAEQAGKARLAMAQASEAGGAPAAPMPAQPPPMLTPTLEG